jgi:fermentation-respiration switch protein FrsA (DUF1100 family)
MFRIALATFVAALSVALGAAVSTASPSTGSGGLFDYDRTAPLDATFSEPVSWPVWGGVVRQTVSYRATTSLRLKAFFVHPASGGPWPLVIWSPGAGGDRRQQLPEAIDLARSDVASLLIDEAPLGNCHDAQHEVDLHVSYVISRRRAVDLAQTLPNVDTTRIAASGFSRGAAVTAALAGVEHRIHTFVLESGRGHLTGYLPIFCTNLGPAELGPYVATLGVVDPVRWLRKATGAAVLLQNGTKDTLSPRADVLALYAAARKPRELRWYPAGHELNRAATTYRAQWLLRQLQLR